MSLGKDIVDAVKFTQSNLAAAESLANTKTEEFYNALSSVPNSVIPDTIISNADKALTWARQQAKYVEDKLSDKPASSPVTANGGDNTNPLLFALGSSASTEGKSFLQALFSFFKDSIYGAHERYDDSDVIGAPPKFTGIADPFQLVFNSNMFVASSVVTIIPGNLVHLKVDVPDAYKAQIQAEYEDAVISGSISPTTSLMQQVRLTFAGKNPNGNTYDFRFYSFEVANMEFRSYYNLALSRLAGYLLSLPELVPADFMTLVGGQGNKYDPAKATGWGGYRFYIERGTSISESASNDYEDSMYANFINSTSAQIKEVKATFAHVFGGSTDEQATEEQAKENAKNAAAALADSGDGPSLGAMFTGDKINIPKVWSNSAFSRSYSLSFKLETPYGDNFSILKEVLSPLAFLMTLSLPRVGKESGFTYSKPFVIRLDCPGWFIIDTGVVTSMSIRRGADEHSWNENGLCTFAEVTLDIMDIYPALAISNTATGLMVANMNQQAYLDNLVGQNYRMIFTGGSFIHNLKATASRLLLYPSAMVGSLASKTRHGIDKAINSAGKFFGGF